MTTAILDAVRESETKTKAAALDTIAAAAKAVVAGGKADADAVAEALAAIGQTSADFEKAVQRARDRTERLDILAKLPAAKSKLQKAETTLQAEFNRFIEIRDAFAEKAAILEQEIDEARATIRDGDRAREMLLDPANVPGGLSIRYGEAVAEAREAQSANSNAEDKLAQAERRVKGARDHIFDLTKDEPENVDPTKWKAPANAPEWHRDGHHGELEKYHRRWREACTERDTAKAALAEASKTYAAAKKRRDSLAQEALKP